MLNKPIEVLIVEDDETAAQLLGQFTQKEEGFSVTAIANTAEQALDLLEIHSPHLILLDIYLPSMNGIDLLWEIRRKYRDIHIILITASNDAETIKEAIRGGVFGYIVKPVMIDRLISTLKKFRTVSQQLDQPKIFHQEEIDQFFGSLGTHEKRTEKQSKHAAQLPKGIDALTLRRIKEQLLLMKESLNADELAKSIGITHSTARRYLEFLVSLGEVSIEVQYGAVGRPERKYKKAGME